MVGWREGGREEGRVGEREGEEGGREGGRDRGKEGTTNNSRMGTLESDLSQCQDTADSIHLSQDRIPHVGRKPVTKGLKG